MPAPNDGAKAGQGGGFGVNEALSLASFGLAIGKQVFGDKVQEQKAYNQAYNTAFNNAIGQYQAEKENEQKIKSYEAKLDFVKEQITNNFIESQAFYTSKQIQMQETLGKAAFKSQSMAKALTKSLGISAAREVYGKSARRAALLENLGEYGRQRREFATQLMSNIGATGREMQATQRKTQAQNRLAISQASAMPIASTFIPTPSMSMGAPGIGETLGGILGAGIDAFAGGWENTKQGESFFGIERKHTPKGN